MTCSRLCRPLPPNSKKFWVKSAGLALWLVLVLPLSAREGVVRLVKTMTDIGAFRASINITNGATFQSGELLYAPGKMRLELSDGRTIATNGKELQVLDASARVLGIQELEDPQIVGLGWLLKGYLIKEDGRKARLIRDDNSAFYREVMLEWDDSFRLIKISLWPPRSDNWTTILFNGYRAPGDTGAAQFQIKPEPGFRVISNPLNSE